MDTPTFDYIADDALYTALEAAAAELRAVLRVPAPQAATLLAGSIIERALHAGLVRLGMSTTTDIASLLDAALRAGTVTARTHAAAAVLHDYRALLDFERPPGEPPQPDAHSAAVAGALVGLIDAELSAFLFAHTAPTARQVQRRMAAGVLPTELVEPIGRMQREQLQLLMEALVHQALLPPDWGPMGSPADSRVVAYRSAFATLPDNDKPAAAHQLALLLIDPAHETRVAPLFRSTDLQYVQDESTRSAVVRHLLHRIASLSRGNSQISEGLGAVLRIEEAAALVDAAATAAMSNSRTDEGFQIVEREFAAMGPDLRKRVQSQVRTWVKYYDDNRMPFVANELRQLELRLRNPAIRRWFW